MEIKKKFDEMSVLSPLLFLYTLVYLAMMVGDFAAREKFDMPSGMMADNTIQGEIPLSTLKPPSEIL